MNFSSILLKLHRKYGISISSVRLIGRVEVFIVCSLYFAEVLQQVFANIKVHQNHAAGFELYRI